MTADKPTPVPILRFPELRDSAEWQKVSLSRLLTFQNGCPFSSSDFGEERQGLRLIRNRDLRSEDRVVYYDGHPLPDFIVNDGDLLVGMDGDFTPCVWHKGTGLLNQRVGRILPLGKHVLRFLGYLLEIHLKAVQEDTARTTVKHLSSRTVEGMVVHVPNPDEQQHIADCLGSLDDLIAADGRKLEALRQHKQGLMQQLFPQPGETAPSLRFPEFHNDPEWEGKELGDVSEVLMCKRIFASETNPNGGVPFYKIGTLGGVPDAFISKDLFEEYKSKYNFPRTGEVLITCSGTVGKCLPYDGSEAYFQDSNIVWIDNSKLKVSNEFLLSILSNVNWSTLNSTTITRIYGPDLRGLAIKFPQNEKEQKCIADCLFSVDDLISDQAENLVALQTHKEGLLQQLFPSLESQ